MRMGGNVINLYVLTHRYCLYSLTGLLAAWVLGEIYIHFQASADASYRESVTDWALGILTVLGLFVPLQLTFSHRTSLSPPWVFASAGLLILACGIALRLYAAKVLGSYFTTMLSVSDDQRLVKTGPYRYVRHPSYSGAILAFLGLALSFSSPYTLICPAAISIGVTYRIGREEKMLTRRFGASYDQYRRATHALWPRWSSLLRGTEGRGLPDTQGITG